jgi:hypothetical protein
MNLDKAYLLILCFSIVYLDLGSIFFWDIRPWKGIVNKANLSLLNKLSEIDLGQGR